MKKLITIFVLCMVFVLAGCSSTEAPQPQKDTTAGTGDKKDAGTTGTETSVSKPEATKQPVEKKDGGTIALSFKNAASLDYLHSIDGEQVTINGYLATSSPADGSFIFLMNLPYQSCPFCVPNTSQLANTLEVYPKKGETFGFTTQAVSVTGTLVCATDELFYDDYGYEFSYKLVDADYKILSDDDLSAEMTLWQKIADSGIVTDLYDMYNYVDMCIEWNNYYQDAYVDENGEEVKGFFYYPTDAEDRFNAWYSNYLDGSAFDDLAKRLKEFNNDSTDSLVENVKMAKALAQKGQDKITNGDYTFEFRYVEEFDNEDYVYSINGQEELFNEFDTIYAEFADWIASWEL